MYLNSLKVQHYKSLDDVSVDFAPDVTVVVGPNGVGKSNFVDVLRFLRDAVKDDLEHAVTKREGIQRLLQTYKTKPPVIGIQCTFNHTENSIHQPLASYSVQLRSTSKTNYFVVKEDAYFYLDKSDPGDYLERSNFERTSNGRIRSTLVDLETKAQRAQAIVPNSPISRDALALQTSIENSQFDSFGYEIADQIVWWNFCTIYPNTLKKPARPDRDTHLMESGDNWASVIKALKRSPKGREALERIYDAMRAVLPTFEEVSIQTVGSYLVPLFKFRVEGESSLASFDPVQLSDGTLRLFGILLAAYQLPHPKLLVIEEPEQTIYPGALAVLADVFKEIGKNTQVLITTHSPHLVQFFEPSQIRVAVMHNGMTQIRPIHPHQMEAVNEGLLSLEEFMTTEGLRPDDTDQISL